MDFQAPAIVDTREFNFGLSYGLVDGVVRVEYDKLILPRDWKDATLVELLPFIPSDLQGMPFWSLQAMMVISPFIIAVSHTVTFITTTSASNQTYSVPAGWNISNNWAAVVSHGGNGGNDFGGGTFWGGGGGGGGFAYAVNLSLTPGGSATFRLRAGGSGTGTSNACWFDGTSLALSSVGVQGAANGGDASETDDGGGGSGASTTSAIGSIKYAGGNGGKAAGGGGAGGPSGAGGSASDYPATAGGTGDGGTVAADTAGSQYTSIPGGTTAGPGGGRTQDQTGSGEDGPLYGGGASGKVSGAGTPGTGGQGLIVLSNN